MEKLKLNMRQVRIGIVGLFVFGIIVYVVASSADTPKEPPAEFLVARQNAALISQHITDLTAETAGFISNVKLSGLGSDADASIQFIQDARNSNGLAHAKAFELSQSLKTLAESMSALSSRESQRIAYEAVAVELSLVSEFITYTNRLNNLLDALMRAINTNTSEDRNAARTLLEPVNESVEKINSLNKYFLERMDVLDRSLR